MSEPHHHDLYRCTVHGGSKDWAIAVTPEGDISILNCATGHVVRRTNVPRGKFKCANATAEMAGRVQEKLQKGYEYLGSTTVESNRLKLSPTTAPAASAVEELWEIVRPLSPEAVEEKLSWAATQLWGHVAPDVVEYDHDLVVLRTATHAQGVKHGWALGYSDEGGIQPTGRGGGRILLRQGLLPRLILLFMWRSFPDAIWLSDGVHGMRTPQIAKDDDFIGKGLFDYERVLALGERLGLCLGKINLLQSTEEGRSAFWL
ncbi:hypothetical protein [Steroidobacter sp.]|uniref:hypothetical protein n=1 Tax=Steroidobacter sp. TaxID=1978227 RepID=UPI001A634B03|nr:hypothetical protein [Steroidobacter sp.]MBL8269559.1 hypothetical protein [Steroidobacter sp.]